MLTHENIIPKSQHLTLPVPGYVMQHHPPTNSSSPSSELQPHTGLVSQLPQEVAEMDDVIDGERAVQICERMRGELRRRIWVEEGSKNLNLSGYEAERLCGK